MSATETREAIRVRKRGRGEYFSIHWLTDADGTVCGLDVAALDVVETLFLEDLPRLEACGACLRSSGGWKPGLARLEAPPEEQVDRWEAGYGVAGRVSKQGKLRQTGKSGHGNRLRP